MRDDAVLVADSKGELNMLVEEFWRMCEEKKLKVNVGKNKVLRFSSSGEQESLRARPQSEELQEVSGIKYLEYSMTANGSMEGDFKES